MRIFFIFLISYSSIFCIPSNEIKESPKTSEFILSTSLDYIPIIGNLKSFGEALTGKDIVTGQNLSLGERALSLLGAIPLGNYFKSGKHLKNAKKFTKAAKRASLAGKLNNAVKFSKAGARAWEKGNKLSKIINLATKTVKNIFKFFGNEKEEKEKYELLKYKELISYEMYEEEPYIRLYMEVDEIKAKAIYLYVYIFDSTNIDFSYQFLNQGDLSELQVLSPYTVVDYKNEHIVYYKINKPKENGIKIYFRIKASNFEEGQKIIVESRESIINVNLIIAIAIIILMTIITYIIYRHCFNVNKDKTIKEKNNAHNDDIINKNNHKDVKKDDLINNEK